MTEAGFDLLPGTHPITPVMFPGEDGAVRATRVAEHMLADGVYVIAFSYPVVPRGGHASASSCRPGIPRTTCGAVSMPSSRPEPCADGVASSSPPAPRTASGRSWRVGAMLLVGQLLVVVVATVLLMAVLTAVPARLGCRRP